MERLVDVLYLNIYVIQRGKGEFVRVEQEKFIHVGNIFSSRSSIPEEATLDSI